MKSFIPGQSFKNNKYYLFDKHGVTVMKPWPHMTAYRKTKTKGWQAVRPKFVFREHDIPNKMNLATCHRCELNELYEQDYDHECQPHPLNRYLALVPNELLELTKEVRSRQWHLLALFARCGEKAIELYKSTPALAWMLASSWAFKRQPVRNHFRSIRALFQSGKSQLQILKWLDYPSSKQTIKLLRKVEMRDIDVTFFLHLKDIIINQVSFKTLRHIPRIDYSLLRLLVNLPYDYSFGFLESYQQLQRKQHHFIKSTLQDIVEASDSLNEIDLKVLNLILATYPAQEEASATKAENQHRTFPWPRFKMPENFPEIEYLDTEDKLFDAAEVMHNCLDSLAEIAYSNAINFFRINYPQPVIFSVTESPVINGFIVNEIKGQCNQEPTDNALKIIEKWISEANRLNPELCIEIQY